MVNTPILPTTSTLNSKIAYLSTATNKASSASTTTKAKTTKAPSKTASSTSAINITPRKMEAIAVLIRAITGLISEIRKAIAGAGSSSNNSSATTISSSTIDSNVGDLALNQDVGTSTSGNVTTVAPSGASSASGSTAATNSTTTPSITTSTPGLSPTTTGTTDPNMSAFAGILNQILEKLSQIQQALSSLLGIGGSTALAQSGTPSLAQLDPTSAQYYQNQLQASAQQEPSSTSWLDILGTVANTALDFLPGMSLIKGGRKLLAKGAGFITKAVKSLF